MQLPWKAEGFQDMHHVCKLRGEGWATWAWSRPFLMSSTFSDEWS